MRRLACILGFLLVVGGCKIEKVEPPTEDPVIVSLRVSSYLVSPGGYTEILAWASDPDLQDDTLYYEWSVEPQDGRFTDTTDTNETSTANPIRWWPETPGEYTITLKVKDGRGGEADTSFKVSVAHYALVRIIGEEDLTMPYGLSVEEDEIWVADPSQKMVFVFDLEGNKKGAYPVVIREIDNGETTYTEMEPYDIEVGDSLLYVVSLTAEGCRYGKLDEENERIVLTGKYATSEKNLYVMLREGNHNYLLVGVNDGNVRLRIVDRTLLTVSEIKIEESVAGGITNDGERVYEAFYLDTLIAGVRWWDIDDPYNTYSTFYDSLHNPRSVGYWNDTLFVGDAPEGQRRIVVLNASDGSYIEKFGTLGNGPDQLNMPTDIEVRNGLIYVVDMGNHAIKVFEKQ